VHKEENEEVVQRVLASCNGRFRLAPCLPKWPHRGLESFGEVGRLCVRASLQHGCTNGFFVARFERVRPGENQAGAPAAHSKTVGADQAAGAVTKAATHGSRAGNVGTDKRSHRDDNSKANKRRGDASETAGRDKKPKTAAAAPAEAPIVPLTAIDVD